MDTSGFEELYEYLDEVEESLAEVEAEIPDTREDDELEEDIDETAEDREAFERFVLDMEKRVILAFGQAYPDFDFWVCYEKRDNPEYSVGFKILTKAFTLEGKETEICSRPGFKLESLPKLRSKIVEVIPRMIESYHTYLRGDHKYRVTPRFK